MRRWNGRFGKGSACLLAAGFAFMMLSGCGEKEKDDLGGQQIEKAQGEDTGTQPGGQENSGAESAYGAETTYESAIRGESAQDASVDFAALKEENPDIFAWLYIPGTDIDAPVLQSAEADDYYESHNASGEEDPEGALYTELANLRNMCDFNTVIHGKGGEGGLFADLYQFSNPDFFEAHEDIYLYLEGNVLVYTVAAAYERENTSLIRSYDFTYGSGCEKFLEDMYGARAMGMNLREGWDEITPYHFLVTLTTQKDTDPERQFVVVAVLTQDGAGEISRSVEWQ